MNDMDHLHNEHKKRMLISQNWVLMGLVIQYAYS